MVMEGQTKRELYLVNIFCSFSTPNRSYFVFVEGVMEGSFSAVTLFSVVYLHIGFVSEVFIVFIFFTVISVSVSGFSLCFLVFCKLFITDNLLCNYKYLCFSTGAGSFQFFFSFLFFTTVANKVNCLTRSALFIIQH